MTNSKPTITKTVRQIRCSLASNREWIGSINAQVSAEVDHQPDNMTAMDLAAMLASDLMALTDIIERSKDEAITLSIIKAVLWRAILTRTIRSMKLPIYEVDRS